nr:hypothetical protein [Tanacetum cinerariifolium]
MSNNGPLITRKPVEGPPIESLKWYGYDTNLYQGDEFSGKDNDTTDNASSNEDTIQESQSSNSEGKLKVVLPRERERKKCEVELDHDVVKVDSILDSLTYKLANERKYVSIVDDDTFPNHKSSLTVPQPVHLLECIITLNSVNGLLCLYGSRQDAMNEKIAVLWNPSVEKAVAFRTCDLTFCHVFVDGFIYWPAYHNTELADGIRSNLIISFDLKSDEFCDVSLPGRFGLASRRARLTCCVSTRRCDNLVTKFYNHLLFDLRHFSRKPSKSLLLLQLGKTLLRHR